MAVKGKAKYASEPQREEKGSPGPKAISPVSTPEFTMDAYLAKLNLYRKPIAKDGSCLFRVVSEQVYHTQARHFQVRQECIDYMHKNKELLEAFIEGSYEHHLYNLRNPKEWGGQVEIYALSNLYKRDFIVYQPGIPSPQQVTCNGFVDKISLCYLHGNHYDAVYPLAFQSNAAMVQSILYDVLLDDVFPEIGRRELNEECKNSGVNSGWTEVKAKKNGGKSPDEPTDRITSAIPEAGKNPKVMWQIKRSLDTNNYRNIELEVWENFKTDLQPIDVMMRSPVHLKPGDLCLATIKESKDVSDTIRVKIHEIKPDKCVVFSENLKNKFYVPLNDLQPLVNGCSNSSYKNLPGYYNKVDFDSEFQSQRRRGRGNRKPRESDERHRKSEFNGNSRYPENIKHHEQKYEKEIRNNRRPFRKDENKRKDIDNRDLKSPVNKKPEFKRPELVDQVEIKVADIIDSETPTLVAKPAESSAAFWGRMRMKPNGSSCDKVSETSRVTVNSCDKICETVPSSKHVPDNNNLDNDNKIKIHDHHPIDGDKNEISPLAASSTLPLSSDTKSVDSKCEQYKPGWVTTNHVIAMKTADNANNSVTNENAVTYSHLNGSSVSTNPDVKTFINSNAAETQKLFNLSTQASARVNEVRENIIASSTKLAGKVCVNTKSNGTVNCNFTDVGSDESSKITNYEGCIINDGISNSDSSSYNESIDESSSMTTHSCSQEESLKSRFYNENHIDHSRNHHGDSNNCEENGYGSENNDDSDLGDDDYQEDDENGDSNYDSEHNEDGDENNDNKDEGDDDDKDDNDDDEKREGSDGCDDADEEEEEDEGEEEESVGEDDNDSNTSNLNESGKYMNENEPAEISDAFQNMVVSEQNHTMNADLESIDSSLINAAHAEPIYSAEVPSEVMYYPDIKEPSDQQHSVFIENSHTEKHDHSHDHLKYVKDKSKKKVSFGCTTEIIEKPQRVISQVNIESTSPINNTEPGKIVLPPEHIEKHMNEFPIMHIPDVVQQPQVIHPAYVHSGMSFYPHPHISPVLPMFSSAPLNDQSPITLSRDPEGKDLPEDINILRYFFNLGVQWHYANQQTNMQLNQPGILPLPVHAQQMSSLSVRPLMMNADPTIRSMEYYTPNSQGDNSQIDLRQQQQALLLQTRLQHVPGTNLTLPHFHGAPYEEYELPPRLRRGPAKGNNRFSPQRQALNGRGIMGQGPRVRCDNNRTTHQMLNYSAL